MQLLLLLSALLSGLTGVISGERLPAPSNLERGSAEVAAIAEEMTELAVQAPVSFIAASPAFDRQLSPYFAVAAAPAIEPFRFSERRLE